MKKIAIVGAGPTGIYTLFSLLKQNTPLCVTVYEQAEEAGVGMPYSDEDNSRMMLANIASIEIPPLFQTYLEWLRAQSEAHLARYGVQKSALHDRQFLPRILLGQYFRDRFQAVVTQARKQGFEVNVLESCQVTDLQASAEGVSIWSGGKPTPEHFELAVIATGHVWPDEDTSPRDFFPSPWSGLMEASIAAGKVGIMGTSLSGLDAAMAVAAQHGTFIETDDEQIRFRLDEKSEALKIVLMSRSGILPEADFYCPIPYEPLSLVTDRAIEAAIQQGSEGLLDRVFRLMVEELKQADPQWSKAIALETLTPDTIREAWFADRRQHGPFRWAVSNLDEVERNKRDRRTVPWRYTVLRLHEAVEKVVPHLDDNDRERFKTGLARVFIDNYAAIPSRSIRRLLALREAGIISIEALGDDYEMTADGNRTVIDADGQRWIFDTFIDARGQKPLKTKDLPFPSLREQLVSAGEEIPDVGDDYTLLAPDYLRGRIAFGALPYLMHDRPFVQGLVACAEIGEAMAKAAAQPASRVRRRLAFTAE
ncbi:FAD-NAD(P)-binding protein [Leclercia adecarboxylata]|uniref:FAD-NAD(P)-binding protein n=1 Tax=Leclercia adecarboxylata TaxID=83655 RepID=UPI002DBA95DC|nr:FAD-NAD(P)-binding protein [Leclercia adecarboxylata]MEB6377403.1 FAD-NAD(P)-binding protein [Leclercia adecarboxylata]